MLVFKGLINLNITATKMELDRNRAALLEEQPFPFGYYGKLKKLFLQLKPELFEPNIDRALYIGFSRSRSLYDFLKVFSPKQLIGVDYYHKKMQSISRELKEESKVRVLSGDVNALNFEDGQFELVFLGHCLGFIHDIEKTFETLKNLAQKKTQVVLAVEKDAQVKPQKYYCEQEKALNYKIPDLEALEKAIEKTGFKQKKKMKSAMGSDLWILQR